MADLIVGGIIALVATFVAGASGFGLGLVATPLLLLAGFPLPFVVTANLSLGLATRVAVAYRFRGDVPVRPTAILVLASIPGLYLGALTLDAVDEDAIKAAAGVVVMAAAVALWLVSNRHPPPPVPGGRVLAGVAGGFLGTTTSLSGVPPVLLLAHERAAARAFFAELAVYFVCSAAAGLALLAATGEISERALVAAVVWLPIALAGNAAGTSLGVRLPQGTFQLLTLAVVFAGGAVTVATVIG